MTYLKIASGVVLSAVTFVWGGFDAIFAVLLCLMAIDYITGVMSAVREKKLSSQVGFNGLLRKAGMLAVVALSHFTGVYTQIAEVRSLVIGFYIANEGISILENAALLGVPLPQKLVEVLKQLEK